MKVADKEKIYLDSKFVLIEFRSSFSSGRLVIKNTLYELKKKSIEKLLKGCEYLLNNDYVLSLNEFIEFDEEYIALQKQKKRLYLYLDYYQNHYRDEDYNETLKAIKDNDKKILTRTIQLREIYKGNC